MNKTNQGLNTYVAKKKAGKIMTGNKPAKGSKCPTCGKVY